MRCSPSVKGSPLPPGLTHLQTISQIPSGLDITSDLCLETHSVPQSILSFFCSFASYLHESAWSIKSLCFSPELPLLPFLVSSLP